MNAPARPRLSAGVALIPRRDGALLRTARGALWLSREEAETFASLAPRLDGARTLAQVCEGVSARRVVALLGQFSALAAFGALRDGPAPPPLREDMAASVRSVGYGELAEALRTGDDATSPLALCSDRPDWAWLRRMRPRRKRFFVAIGFGDAVLLAGPLGGPRGATLEDVRARRLAASPTIALEREALGHAALIPAISRASARGLAGAIARTLLRWSDSTPRAALLDRESGACDEGPLLARPRRRWARPASDWDCGSPGLPALGAAVEAAAQGPCAPAALAETPARALHPPPGCPHVRLARFSPPDTRGVGRSQDNWTHGAATDRAGARALALIEAFERIAGLAHARVDLVASLTQAGAGALDPRRLGLFSARQCARPGFPFRAYDPRETTDWTWARDMTRGEAILVPSAAAWHGADAPWICETSSGMAAHGALRPALVKAAFELIERDAFMIAWLNRLSPPTMDAGDLDEGEGAACARRVSESGYTVRLLDLTSDVDAPVCLALATRRDGRAPALIVGAACDLNPRAAIFGALKELHSAFLTPGPGWRPRPPLAAEAVRRLRDHARAYEHPDWLDRAAFLWARAGGDDAAALARFRRRGKQVEGDDATLDALTRALGAVGAPLIGVDVTPADVASTGLRVARALIPGLQPLGFGERIRLGGRRVYEAPVAMGLRGAPLAETALNRDPHCFP